MNRYYVTTPEGTLKYYAESEEAVKKSFPNATDVRPCKNIEYLDYIAKIKERSKMRDSGLWIVDTAFGKYYYRQFLDDENNLIDGCKWRKVDATGYVEPVLWTLDTPKEFFDMFLKSDYYDVEDTSWTRIDYLEWAKVKKQGGFKALKTSDPIDKSKYWANPQGVIYEINRQLNGAKKAWQEYKKNPSAFADIKPPYNPDLSKNCFRLPYMPIMNPALSVYEMAKLWRMRIREELDRNLEYRIFCRGEVGYTIEALETIIDEARAAFYNSNKGD